MVTRLMLGFLNLLRGTCMQLVLVRCKRLGRSDFVQRQMHDIRDCELFCLRI